MNALSETASIIVVVQKHRKALCLKRMSKFLSSRLLSFIKRTTLVKISKDALPQLTKAILMNHFANVSKSKTTWSSWYHNKKESIDIVS